MWKQIKMAQECWILFLLGNRMSYNRGSPVFRLLLVWCVLFQRHMQDVCRCSLVTCSNVSGGWVIHLIHIVSNIFMLFNTQMWMGSSMWSTLITRTRLKITSTASVALAAAIQLGLLMRSLPQITVGKPRIWFQCFERQIRRLTLNWMSWPGKAVEDMEKEVSLMFLAVFTFWKEVKRR